MGRYDPAERKRSVRKGRERGCWVYIAAEELSKTGIPPDGPPPAYTTFGSARGLVRVRLFKPK